MMHSLRSEYVQLNENYTTTLDEIRGIYDIITSKDVINEGERISKLKLDLTVYDEYHGNGRPRLSSEEYPFDHSGKTKSATYNPKQNMLMIWESGFPVYQNWDGVITTDRDALGDTYGGA